MRMRQVTRACLFQLVIGLLCASALAQPRQVTFEDIMAVKSVSGAVISPDGTKVLFTVRRWESPAGKPETHNMRSHVWLVPADGSEPPRQITFSEAGESSPAWSPDGRFISFVSARPVAAAAPATDDGPRPQLWLMRTDGGEAWRLTEAKEGVQVYAWSPDSARIAFTAREPLPKEVEERRKRRDDARVFEGEFQLARLWTIDVTTRQATELTPGAPFTVQDKPDWSPDGQQIVFAATPTPMIRDERQRVYMVPAAGKAWAAISPETSAGANPVFSPDGRSIAWVTTPGVGKPNAEGIATRPLVNGRLTLYDVASKTAADAASPSFDNSPGAPQWSRDGRRIHFVTGVGVYRDLFAFEPAGRRYARVTRGLVVSGPSFSKDGTKAAFTMESAENPAEVYVSDGTLASPRRLTSMNPALSGLAMGKTQVLTWKSSEGWEVEGLLLEPIGYQPGKAYPLLVVVHGGPTGAFFNTFRMTAGDPGQHFAGQGWAVLYPNPRGSTNYGEKFMRGNIPDWGGGDYRDIMTGVDQLVRRGVADPSRLAVMGWSYGGYMTCWIVSQTTRFKAAMMGAGLSNIHSMYGTTDIPGYIAAFYNGAPSKETLPLYFERSGLTTADAVTTPLLILHGSNDERVPIGQPMEFYRALKDRGKTVELVFYPREGHGLSEYYHQLDRLKRQYDWLAKHTLGVPATVR